MQDSAWDQPPMPPPAAAPKVGQVHGHPAKWTGNERRDLLQAVAKDAATKDKSQEEFFRFFQTHESLAEHCCLISTLRDDDWKDATVFLQIVDTQSRLLGAEAGCELKIGPDGYFVAVMGPNAIIPQRMLNALIERMANSSWEGTIDIPHRRPCGSAVAPNRCQPTLRRVSRSLAPAKYHKPEQVSGRAYGYNQTVTTCNASGARVIQWTVESAQAAVQSPVSDERVGVLLNAVSPAASHVLSSLPTRKSKESCPSQGKLAAPRGQLPQIPFSAAEMTGGGADRQSSSPSPAQPGDGRPAARTANLMETYRTMSQGQAASANALLYSARIGPPLIGTIVVTGRRDIQVPSLSAAVLSGWERAGGYLSNADKQTASLPWKFTATRFGMQKGVKAWHQRAPDEYDKDCPFTTALVATRGNWRTHIIGSSSLQV